MHPYPPPLRLRTNGLAIAALVTGLLCFTFVGAVLAVVFGSISLGQIKASQGWQRGSGMAMAGIVLGVAFLALVARARRCRDRVARVTGIDSPVERPVDSSVDSPFGYDLSAWGDESRYVLDWLLREQGIEPAWRATTLVVPVADRAAVDDLVAYLNGSAAPGVVATGPTRVAFPGPAPAWYPNPEDAGSWRWWDGSRWTAFTVPAPPAYRPWFPPRDRAAGSEGETRLRGGGWVALAGFVLGMGLSIGIVLLALSLGASERSVLLLVLSALGLWSGLAGACLIAVRRYGTGSLRDLGLDRPRWLDIGTGVVTSIVARVVGVVLALALIMVLPDESYTKGTSLLDQSRPSVLAMIVVGLIVVVGAPFFEELFFRGLVQGALQSRIGARGAVVVQAFAFGAVHYQIGMGIGTFAITFVVVGVSGLLFGVLRWHTHHLAPGMFAHAAFNLVAVVVTFASL